eukprot:17400-Prymnesium_polylepis.1
MHGPAAMVLATRIAQKRSALTEVDAHDVASPVRVWRIKKHPLFGVYRASSRRRSQGTPRAAHAHRSAPVLRHNPVPCHS